jgi:methionyl-tRNA synthetase
MVIQVSIPCPKCGSYYRDNDKCNKCGEASPIKEEEKTVFVSHSDTAKEWSKKRHRYLTHDEIKNGERGG